MKQVFVIGGTTFDHIVYLSDFPQPIAQTIHNSRFNETTGSTGSGKIVSLKKLGVPSVLYSLIGDDEFGKQIISYLDSESIDFLYDVDPKGTERHVNLMNNKGERISIFVTQSSEHPEMEMHKIREQISKSDIIVINIVAYCKHIIPELKGINKPIWTDLHDYTDFNPYHEPFIEIADYLFLSSDNLPNHKSTMQNLMNRGKELVVCTHGRLGATALDKNGQWFEVDAVPNIDIVDTNGAGDNFFSGFLYAWVNNLTMQECLQFAAVCGASSVMSKQLVNSKLSVNWVQKQCALYYNL